MLITYYFLKKNHITKKNVFEHIIGYNDNGVIRPLYLNILNCLLILKNLRKMRNNL